MFGREDRNVEGKKGRRDRFSFLKRGIPSFPPVFGRMGGKTLFPLFLFGEKENEKVRK